MTTPADRSKRSGRFSIEQERWDATPGHDRVTVWLPFTSFEIVWEPTGWVEPPAPTMRVGTLTVETWERDSDLIAAMFTLGNRYGPIVTPAHVAETLTELGLVDATERVGPDGLRLDPGDPVIEARRLLVINAEDPTVLRRALQDLVQYHQQEGNAGG